MHNENTLHYNAQFGDGAACGDTTGPITNVFEQVTCHCCRLATIPELIYATEGYNAPVFPLPKSPQAKSPPRE